MKTTLYSPASSKPGVQRNTVVSASKLAPFGNVEAAYVTVGCLPSAPGEYPLYHEWGHHVDRTWSGDNQEVVFSFRWFSHFYTLFALPSRIAYANLAFPVDSNDFGPIESEAEAANAVLLWWQATSELFADLFEDWMRGEKKVSWNHCDW